MGVRRIVPNILSQESDLCRAFYADFLGLRQAMNMGWIATYVSPTNPTAQVSIVQVKDAASATPTISVEVDDVDEVHGSAQASGYRVVYPLTNEPWGVRRFWVEDPNGVVVNVMSHRPSGEKETA